MLDGQCPRCRGVAGLVYLHRWQRVERTRPVTKADLEVLGRDGLDALENQEGIVSDDGMRITFSALAALFGCRSCERSWWTTQPALLTRAVETEEMSPPDEIEFRA